MLWFLHMQLSTFVLGYMYNVIIWQPHGRCSISPVGFRILGDHVAEIFDPYYMSEEAISYLVISTITGSDMQKFSPVKIMKSSTQAAAQLTLLEI